MQYRPVTSSIQRGRSVQYMATDTAQGVVGGCIYLGKWYLTDNLTQISSYCDESRCSWDSFRMLIWLHLDPLIIPVWFYRDLTYINPGKISPKYSIMFKNWSTHDLELILLTWSNNVQYPKSQSMFYQNWLFLRKCLFYKTTEISVISIIKKSSK